MRLQRFLNRILPSKGTRLLKRGLFPTKRVGFRRDHHVPWEVFLPFATTLGFRGRSGQPSVRPSSSGRSVDTSPPAGIPATAAAGVAIVGDGT